MNLLGTDEHNGMFWSYFSGNNEADHAPRAFLFRKNDSEKEGKTLSVAASSLKKAKEYNPEIEAEGWILAEVWSMPTGTIIWSFMSGIPWEEEKGP